MFELIWKAENLLSGIYRRAWIWLWILSVAASSSNSWADDAVDAPGGVLQLHRGDFLAGRLVAHTGSDQLAWQHPAFDTKFLFPLRAITGAAFAEPAEVTRAAGEFCVELTNGDRWYGSVVGIDGHALTLRSPGMGDLPIRREMLRRLFRWSDGKTLLYSGPGALADWQQSGDGDPWEDRGGQLRTDQTLTSIYGDIGLPDQAQLEIEVSWSGKPNFVIAIGVDEDPSSVDQALRMEVWNQTLVLIRESEDAAAILALGTLAHFDQHLWLSIALDQTTGRATVYSERGKRLGELQLDGDAQQSLPGVRLENISGNVQLESLQVMAARTTPDGSLNAGEPKATAAPAEGPYLQLSDGETIYGQLLRTEDEAWIVSVAEQERSIDPATLAAAEFATAHDPSRENPEDGDAPRLRLATYSGIRATASLEKVEDEKLYVRAEGVDGSVPLRVANLRSLNVLNSAPEHSIATSTFVPGTFVPEWYSSSAPPDAGAARLPIGQADKNQAERRAEYLAGQAQRIGRLELDHTRLHGRLVDAEATDETSAIRFHPLDSADAAALRGNPSGRLVYRDRQPEPTADEQAQRRQRAANRGRANQGILGAFVNAFAGSGPADGGGTTGSAAPSLHLRSGDVLPCEIKRIDEDGIVFESPVVGATHVPHDNVRAVTLTAGSVVGIDDSKRERLLTVPRMRKATPPTHLIVSSDGDFLRGRLNSLDEQTLVFENRLETIEIPRRVVSQIIWFHEDELPDKESNNKPAAGPEGAAGDDTPADPGTPNPSAPQARLRVQSVHRNGVRLTFQPRQVGGGELIGESPQLGVCLLQLGTIDQLLIGREIEADASDSPYHRWRLTHAPEPKVLQEDAEGETPGMRPNGVDSPLIGTAAPDFDLELLAGGTFRLSEQRGKIVVLDFWATWCGPCIQSMPQVEEAVAAFPADGVILVAVNLQEPADQIRTTLERLKRSPTVALDIDGVVASRYHASAIPQTVVIDREGRVTRLFIGGGAKLGEHLRGAIQEAATPP